MEKDFDRWNRHLKSLNSHLIATKSTDARRSLIFSDQPKNSSPPLLVRADFPYSLMLERVGVLAMLFKDRRHEQIAVDSLARLLDEKPIMVDVVNAEHTPYDRCRVLVIALLLASVAGTWSLAFFLGHQ
jgi:hypothetical protein